MIALPQFKFRTAPTVRLVQSSVIAAEVGGNHETVCALFDAGWVFNVSAGTGRKKELRFWPGKAHDLDTVLRDVLGWHSPRWRGEEICVLMQITRTQRKDLTKSGYLPGARVNHTFYATTETLRKFLTRRLVQ